MTANACLVEPPNEDIKNNNVLQKELFHVPGYCGFCGKGMIKDSEKQPEKEKKKKINNGFYLNIIIGNSINLQMNSSERYAFKQDYEKFKLRVTLVNLVLLATAFLFPSRPMDAICHFLMVWYYCTLTIRESILMINGSKMHWWWVAHHYLACVVGGVALTWPDDDAYHSFRPQFLLFTAYICLVQQLQYQYQSGCLRRLHALGHGNDMDVTLEGFAAWMFHGLTFLLPFLFSAYLLELYHSYALYSLWMNQPCVWQVAALSLLFAILGMGNLILTGSIVLVKMRESAGSRIERVLRRYPSIHKSRPSKTKDQ